MIEIINKLIKGFKELRKKRRILLRKLIREINITIAINLTNRINFNKKDIHKITIIGKERLVKFKNRQNNPNINRETYKFRVRTFQKNKLPKINNNPPKYKDTKQTVLTNKLKKSTLTVISKFVCKKLTISKKKSHPTHSPY